MSHHKPMNHDALDEEENRHKLSVEYNLEVDPLQSGIKETSGSWLWSLGKKNSNELDHSSWLAMTLWLATLIFAVGIMTGWAVIAFLSS